MLSEYAMRIVAATLGFVFGFGYFERKRRAAALIEIIRENDNAE